MNLKKALSLTMATAMAATMLSTAVFAEDTWKIGGIGPLTGAAAIYGTHAMWGAQIAVDEINAAGGINGMQVEFNAQDDEHDAEKSVNAYNTLKDWGVQAVVGCVTTNPCIAVSTEAANDNVFMLTPSASSEKVLEAGDNLFQVCFTDPAQGTASAQYIANNLDVTKVAVIYNSADAYSAGIYATFRAEAENQNFEIVSETSFTDDSKTDFSAQIQAAKDAGAELVFLPIYYDAAAVILKQAADAEFAPVWFGVDGMDGILTVEGFDTTLAEGVMLLTPFAADATDDATVNFVTTFQEQHEDIPNQFAADGYDCVYALKAAMEAKELTADMDASAVCDAMKEAFTEIEVSGLTGVMTWTADGKVAKTPTAVVIKDGAYVAFENAQ